MIRVVKSGSDGKASGRYYSLWDISVSLVEHGVISKERCDGFYNAAQRRLHNLLGHTLKANYVTASEEPLIVGLNDWFVYWTGWDEMFFLLPKSARNHPFVRFLSSEIDYEEGILHKDEYDKYFSPTLQIDVPKRHKWE